MSPRRSEGREHCHVMVVILATSGKGSARWKTYIIKSTIKGIIITKINNISN